MKPLTSSQIVRLVEGHLGADENGLFGLLNVSKDRPVCQTRRTEMQQLSRRRGTESSRKPPIPEAHSMLRKLG